MARTALRLVLLLLVGDLAGNAHPCAWSAEDRRGSGGEGSPRRLPASGSWRPRCPSAHPLLVGLGQPCGRSSSNANLERGVGDVVELATFFSACLGFAPSNFLVTPYFIIKIVFNIKIIVLFFIYLLKQIFWSPRAGVGFLCT